MDHDKQARKTEKTDKKSLDEEKRKITVDKCHLKTMIKIPMRSAAKLQYSFILELARRPACLEASGKPVQTLFLETKYLDQLTRFQRGPFLDNLPAISLANSVAKENSNLATYWSRLGDASD